MYTDSKIILEIQLSWLNDLKDKKLQPNFQSLIG